MGGCERVDRRGVDGYGGLCDGPFWSARDRDEMGSGR